MFLWLNIMVTMSMAFWTVSRVFLQPENILYRCHFTVYMAQYDGENIYGNLGWPKGGLVSSKLSLLE